MEKNENIHPEKPKRRIGLYILYGTLTLFVLGIVLSLGDIEEIFSTLKTVNVNYILLAVLALLMYMAIYPLSLCILTKARGCKIKMLRTYNIGMTEHFFNGITPMQTGGQPFQAYSYSRSGVKVSESTSLLLMNFLIFMTTTNIYVFCSLFYFTRFVSSVGMGIIAAIGLTANFLVLVITFLLGKSKKVCALLSRFLDFLCRFGWIAKFLKPKSDSLKTYFVQVQDAFAHLSKKKGAFVLALLTKIVAMGAYYSTTFFILRGFGVNIGWDEMFIVILSTCFAITMVAFIPTPGTSGGIEFAFKAVFAAVAMGTVTNAVATGGMLIWRMLTYYLVMLISLLFYILLEAVFSKEEKKKRLAEAGQTESENLTEPSDEADRQG